MLKSEVTDSVVELFQDKSAAARALANRWINVVMRDLASRGYLESLKREERAALIASPGTDFNTGRNYDLPIDTDKVIKVFIPEQRSDGVLHKVSNERFLSMMLSDGYASPGLPRYYTIFGRLTLRIHPQPSLTYAPASPTINQMLHIWKYKDVRTLGENDVITEISTKATNLLMMGAYCFGARFDSFADYPASKAEYEKAIVDFFFQQTNDLDHLRQTAYNNS